ncbi:cupin domain-containing protein [Actinomadura adrarensis]|uniref:Cupin domain-containing protein n=1 Tax=Actinomadura adrarensis TaxID=1819600 RepID=A0ABW3CP94_9ACTN
MSKLDQKPLRVLTVPAGAGTSVWVYDDVDTLKATGEDTAGRMSLTETIVPPRGGPPPHVHANESESLYILEGDLEILGDDGRMVGVGPGGFVHFPQGVLHRFHNPTDEPSKILIIFTPAGFEEFFLEIGQPVVAGRPGPAVDAEYIARADEIGSRYGQTIRTESGGRS